MKRKLKILHLGYTPADHRYSNDGSLFSQLYQQAETTFIDIKAIRNPEKIDEYISLLVKNNRFDLIYKNYIKAFDTLLMRPLHEYGIPIFLWAGDCHTRLIKDDINQRSNHHKYNVIVVNNGSTISCFKDYFDRDMDYIWLPWSYNPEIHKDYGESKIHDGSIPASHLKISLRRRIHDYLEDSDHSYRWIKGLLPHDYGKAINQCKIGISTCQVSSKIGKSCHFYNDKWIGMTFNKWYEVTMCNTLHMGQESGDAAALGFIDGENSVMFRTLDEFKDKFNFYLKNETERMRVLANGKKIIKPMTYKNRVEKFLSEAQKII